VAAPCEIRRAAPVAFRRGWRANLNPRGLDWASVPSLEFHTRQTSKDSDHYGRKP
jgi:hypothetical protein